MRSLHSGLTLWLWTALAGVGALCAVLGILEAQTETQAQVDYQMQQVANIIASQSFVRSNDAHVTGTAELWPSTHVSHDKDDDLIVTVRNKSGDLLYASRANRNVRGGVLPALDTSGFQTVKIGHGQYRVFAGQSRDLTIQVAQSMDVIREAEGGIALATLLPVGLLLPVLAVVIGFAIRRQLEPLNAAAAAVADRPPLSLEPLPADGIPSEVRPLVDEINRLLGRLRGAVEREQRFVTDAAHALRTPLTALQLQAEVLEGGSDAEERAVRVGELRAGIQRVIRLSQQLLSLARSQSDPGPINTTSDLDTTLLEIAGLYLATARSKAIDLVVDAASSARVYGNARRLTLIFGNLLDNALRFTPHGCQIRIHASAAVDGARVEILDEGCGLPPEELERVFERFYQVPGHQDTGSGLGLSTVQALVSQLGGHVRLENRADRTGLIAVVILPLAPDQTAQHAQTSGYRALASVGSR